MLGALLPGFRGTTLPGWLEARLREGLAGVCLFGPNIASPDQLRALTDAVHAANPRALVAIDEEGGDVTRLYADVGSPSPGNAVLGRVDDLDVTRDAAREIGWQLRRAGCDVDLAPSVDVNSRADNPVIGTRSFGADAERVARHGAAWVAGLQATGVAATAKHFPGHGDTTQDSHLALPVVDRSSAELRERELVPFAAAARSGVRLVMTSHLVLPQVDAVNPATMSRTVLVDLLRGELGFDGVVVSDALDMAGARSAGGTGETAVRALAAGCDLLCLGTENTDAELTEIERAVTSAVRDGALEEGRVRDASDRVRGLSEDLAQQRTLTPEPDSGPGALDLARVVSTFDVQPSVAAWWAQGPYAVVRLDALANTAVGPTPWGPFAAGLATTTGEYERVLIVGRDIHRHPAARAEVDRLRRAYARVLVVDMGWPSEDRRYADVATFGASRLVGRALLAFLEALRRG